MGGRERNWPGAVLFDLDGTLIDSAGDLRATINILLAEDGFGPLPLDAIKAMIGHGLRKLVERAYEAVGRPLGPDDLDRKYQAASAIYDGHLAVHTVLMPGARDALDALARAGVPMAVVTNKPQAPTEAILAHFGIASLFGAVVGGDAGYAAKPAPDILLGAATHLGIDPGAALMVGDSPADAQSGRSAGMALIMVEGGYSSAKLGTLGADAVIDTLADLAEAIETLRHT